MASWVQKLLYSSRAVQEAALQYLQGIMKEEDASIERMIDDLTQSERTTQPERTLAPISQSDSFNLSSDAWHLSEEPSLQEEDTDYDLAYQRLQAKDGEYRYTRGSFIARGGFSHVWRIHDHYLHRTIVSKILSDTSMESKVQFIREAQICAQLQHNGVIPLYDVVEKTNGEIHLLMREIKGNSLYDVIQQLPHQRDPVCDIEEANRALHQIIGQFVQVCQTISYAHARGVVHLDLKPANIMVGFFGETFIIDWGISRPTPPISEQSEVEPPVFFDPELEQNIDFGVIGTPFYMSPEQIENQGIDHRSDIYALGCILVHILFSRKHLPSGLSILEEKRKQSCSLIPETTHPSFTTSQNTIYNFQHLLKICQKSTHHAPKERYQTVHALIQDLELWINGEQRRSKAAQHLQNIQLYSKQIRDINEQIEAEYTKQGGDLVLRFQSLQNQKQTLEKISFTLRQEYQKSIFYLVEDIQKIEEFISMELRTYWNFLRSKDWKIAQRIRTQMELYIDLLPKSHQVTWKEKIARLQNMDDVQVQGTLIPRLEQMMLFQEQIRQHASIILVGPAGVGKTHFAKEYCSTKAFIGKRHCFVNVQNCFDSMDVALQIQKEMSFDSDRVLSLIEIAEKANEEQDIIVLDNCEQLCQEAEIGIQNFIHALNDCRVILTSRKKHNLQGVHQYSLASMTPLEAIELFVDSLSRRSDTLTLEDLQEISKLTELVEHHPLSIELIAQHARKIPISELKNYLSEKFALLRGNISGGSYGSLWETLDWSWNLLTENAQRLLIDIVEWRGTIFQADLLEIHPLLNNLDILHALSELEDLHFLSADTEYEQPTYFVSQSIKDFVYQKRAEEEYIHIPKFQAAFHYYFAHLFDFVSDWSEREARAQQLLHIIGKEDLDLKTRQQCLLNIYTLNRMFGPYNRGFEWRSLLDKGDDVLLLKLFSKIFFLGQRLDFPSEFHQDIFARVDRLQVQEKASMDWFQFYKMKLRYCHLYGALPSHKIRTLIQNIQEKISVLFLDADEATRNQVRIQFDQSLFFYEKETLNHFSSAHKRMDRFTPTNDQERYMKHAILANLYMSIGKYTDSLAEYDRSYPYAEQSNNRIQICSYYRNKGLTYYIMRRFNDAHQMFTASLELSEELQSVESIQFNKNLLSVLAFEKTGNVPNFGLQKGVPLIQNFLLVHATVQDVDKIFSVEAFIRQQKIHPSLSLLRIYLLTCVQLLIDFGVSFHSVDARTLFQKYRAIPEENPLDYTRDALFLCTLWYYEAQYEKALQLIEKSLRLDLGESVDERFSLLAEQLYLHVHLGITIHPKQLKLSIPTICYSNQRVMITAIINLCIASYALEKTELGESYMNTIRELYEKYPFTHLHCKRLQELHKYASHIDTSVFTSQLAHEELTEKRVMDTIKAMIQMSS